MSVTFGWMEINKQIEDWIKKKKKEGRKTSHRDVLRFLDLLEITPILLGGRISKAEKAAKINYVREIKQRIIAAQESKIGSN